MSSQSAGAKELVAEFSGPVEGATREFRVQAPWVLDWLVAGAPAQYNAVDISLYNAETGSFEGDVLKTQNPGNGVRMFNQSGRFYFQVNASMMDWRLKVYQLTADEAKEYKPKL
jgi:hypothetical protein